MTRHDQHGNPTSGPAEAIERYDRAIDRLVRLHPEVVETTVGLVTEHPEVPMGQALVAYLHLMSTDQPDVATGAAAGAAVAAHAGNEREALHAEAIGQWSTGHLHAAARTLDDLLQRWPTDLLALNMGHLLDFATGDAANLRDRIARSLPAFDPAHPHHGFVNGMFAFGLEECGHYARAEAAGGAAVDRNPDDVWAVHAVAHVYEMEGRIDEGIHFLHDRVADWGSGNLFTVHNWWHLALYHLEAGSPAGALGIYDLEVHNDSSEPRSLELLDASAMLWRLRLDGVDVGDRFTNLAKVWDTWQTGEDWYVFNDAHAVVALCGAGRFDDAAAVIRRLEAYVSETPPTSGSNVAMSSEVGLPVSRGILAFAQERYDDAVRELAPIPRIANRFGGSHAQRDLIVRTLTDASLRAGQHDLARALLAERLTMRESSVYGLTRLDQLLRATGAVEDAARAADAAEANRSRFAAAIAPMGGAAR